MQFTVYFRNHHMTTSATTRIHHVWQLCQLLLQKIRSKMYEYSSSIASSDADILIHVDKLKITTLAFQRKCQTGKFPKFKVGIGNVASNTSQYNLAVTAFGIWFGKWRVLYIRIIMNHSFSHSLISVHTREGNNVSRQPQKRD